MKNKKLRRSRGGYTFISEGVECRNSFGRHGSGTKGKQLPAIFLDSGSAVNAYGHMILSAHFSHCLEDASLATEPC